jgi:hexosaminidase
VEIVPATEACGHLHKVLRFEQYSGLAERPHGHVLAPADPHELDFLNMMYGQMVPVFASPIYHIGCDETAELGKGRSQELVQQEGYGKVYVDNLVRVAKLLESYNKQVMFWGDIAVEHPGMIPSLPKNLIVASWEYSAKESYARWLKPFEDTGMKIFVCPWVGNTSVIVPDYEEAAYNIEHFLTDAKKAGAVGTIITVWNDDGETLYAPGWWSIIYGAACAWEPGETSVEDFNRKYDWDFYRNTDHRFAKTMMSLSHLNEIMRAGKPVQTFDMHYGGASDGLFWQNPFSPLGQKEVGKELPVASLIRRTAEEAYTIFADSASRAKRNEDTLASLRFAALRLDALGMRYQFAQEISDRYADAVQQSQDNHQGTGSADLSDISSTNGRLQDLRDYTTRLTELYRELWLSENLPTWLPNMLQLYQRNSDLWQDLIAKFDTLRSEYGQGQALPSPDSLGLLPPQPSGQH